MEETAAGRSPAQLQQSLNGVLSNEAGDLPCVFFEAKATLEIVSVSASVTDLLGVDVTSAVYQPHFLSGCVVAEDRSIFQEKLAELAKIGSVSFIHRFVQGSGLPVWVSHSLRRIERDGETIIWGCLVPIKGVSRLVALEQEMVSRFIHKLGNQFQLLNLVVASLENSLPKSRESEILQETLGKAIDLMRTFSDCNQIPVWVPEVQLLEVMRAAAQSRINEFAASRVQLRMNFEGIPDDAIIVSSPYLLEAALGHVLQNALEASRDGATVEFGGRLQSRGAMAIASLHIRDKGCGIPASERDQVLLPFFTTKKNRDGLGLTLASRFVEMHGGALRINSLPRVGTEVAILLPLESRRDALCS